MKKLIEIDFANSIAIKCDRSFTSNVKIIKYVRHNLSKKKLVRSLIAQHYDVKLAEFIASKIKEANIKDISGWKQRHRIRLHITELYP